MGIGLRAPVLPVETIVKPYLGGDHLNEHLRRWMTPQTYGTPVIQVNRFRKLPGDVINMRDSRTGDYYMR